MRTILLHNWKAKIASLLLAMAIWYLIRLSIPNPIPIPVPGTSPPSIEPSTPVPGVPLGAACFPPACEEVVAIARSHGVFYRLHWFDSGEFTASLLEYPPRVIL